MKTCPKCNRSDVEFNLKTKNGKVVQQTYCKECNKLYQKNHYLQNKKTYREKDKQHVKNRYQNFLVFMQDKSCMDCGHKDPRVLEFDHRDPATKKANVAVLVRSNSWESVSLEMEKCDIVCCNCHRIRTLTRMKSKKMALSSNG